jgi:hypothetical protein
VGAGEPKLTAVPCKGAEYIAVGERDRRLGVNGSTWPVDAPGDWSVKGGSLQRQIEMEHRSSAPTFLTETMVRFPSAPIHGVHRLHERHRSQEGSENFHTMRILRSAEAEAKGQKVDRIFLMHCGLNELRKLGLYYRLASRLINEGGEEGTACVIRPFPGHLSRFPYQAFAETPLDNYLWDGSHLFRQFLRFMIETQWLLSAIVRRSSFRCASGANLLAEAKTPTGSRTEDSALTEAILGDWKRLRDASVLSAGKGERRGRQVARAEVSDAISEDQLAPAIAALRSALDLNLYEPRGAELDATHKDSEPKLHVIGYSLGGFMAQSVFMSWPFLISSCSTLLAGGALRELAPTGFTDPEEWQTVLHSLRYELDDRMMDPSLGVDDDHVAGIDRDLFTYFKRTFYEVFQQDYRGSIQTRYEAFRDRMLFVVGGDDPVVRPQSVLQSGPKGGLNLLEIGGLSHSIDEEEVRDPTGRQQRSFWMPEMASLIHRFAKNAGEEQDAERACTWFDADLAYPLLSRERWNEIYFATDKKRRVEAELRPLIPAETVDIGPEGELSAEIFERCIEDLLYRTSEPRGGVLFVLRNEVPTLMLPPAAVREAAAALYHDDVRIARYCLGIAARRKNFEAGIPRNCLVLPWNVGSVMAHIDERRAYPSQGESAGGQVASRSSGAEIWKQSLSDLRRLSAKEAKRPSVRFYDGRRDGQVIDEDHQEMLKHAQELNREPFVSPPSLPDCWLWLSPEHAAPHKWEKANINRGIRNLISFTAAVGDSDEKTFEAVMADELRIIDVSRARYNPRYRGRLLLDGKAARRRLLHVAACLAMSKPIIGDDAKPALS